MRHLIDLKAAVLWILRRDRFLVERVPAGLPLDQLGLLHFALSFPEFVDDCSVYSAHPADSLQEWWHRTVTFRDIDPFHNPDDACRRAGLEGDCDRQAHEALFALIARAGAGQLDFYAQQNRTGQLKLVPYRHLNSPRLDVHEVSAVGATLAEESDLWLAISTDDRLTNELPVFTPFGLTEPSCELAIDLVTNANSEVKDLTVWTSPHVQRDQVIAIWPAEGGELGEVVRLPPRRRPAFERRVYELVWAALETGAVRVDRRYGATAMLVDHIGPHFPGAEKETLRRYAGRALGDWLKSQLG